ncbi:MAG: phosphoribosylamine--glycine ligase [Elusimicrobia bacterium]|nr:phosphoribosylamine--glycine ligase [Elusimicrobiota bacterium]
MNILVIGSGGREHALVWGFLRSPSVEKVYCVPGNVGMGEKVTRVPINPLDIPELVKFAQEKKIDLTVVGSEAPLAAGLADAMLFAGLNVFGPVRAAARLESSKIFAKKLMKKYEIPTASFEIFENPDSARAYVSSLRPWPKAMVLKADGLTGGKGVHICRTQEEAFEMIHAFMVSGVHGEAGKQVVIEECLEGEEATLMALCDGKALLPLLPSQDHKRLLDGGQGPNTGGMGAYAPFSGVTPALLGEIKKNIFGKFLWALERENIPYRGLLYVGLMLTAEGPKVLEFNVRFGDPETQAVIPLLKSDLAQVLLGAGSRSLEKISLEWENQSTVGVVLTSEGYPGAYKTGRLISGLDQAGAEDGVHLFHAGTDFVKNRWITTGGRVLNVVGKGRTLESARRKAYAAAAKIAFDGCHYRKDIGGAGRLKEYVKV